MSACVKGWEAEAVTNIHTGAGNPVSAFVCFHLMVVPAARAMSGVAEPVSEARSLISV